MAINAVPPAGGCSVDVRHMSMIDTLTAIGDANTVSPIGSEIPQ